MRELELNRDIVQTVIEKARQFQAKEEVTLAWTSGTKLLPRRATSGTGARPST